MAEEAHEQRLLNQIDKLRRVVRQRDGLKQRFASALPRLTVRGGAELSRCGEKILKGLKEVAAQPSSDERGGGGLKGTAPDRSASPEWSVRKGDRQDRPANP